jgi:hypothetical protein
VCRRSADCYAASYGAALTPSSTCCHGRYGVAGINTAHSSATIGDAAAYQQFLCIYGCSTRLLVEQDVSSGRLICWGESGSSVEIWALYNSRRLLSVKVRASLDMLKDLPGRSRENAVR